MTLTQRIEKAQRARANAEAVKRLKRVSTEEAINTLKADIRR